MELIVEIILTSIIYPTVMNNNEICSYVLNKTIAEIMQFFVFIDARSCFNKFMKPKNIVLERF